MISGNLIRVGTRGSRLACAQTEWVIAQLQRRNPSLQFDVRIIRTSGDEDPKRRAARFSGKGIFVREIEDALLSEAIDFAVHSLKDLPTEFPPGLEIGAIPPREDSGDVLVGRTLSDLTANQGAGLRIGTSSLRRGAQLRRAFPECSVVELRGNLDTRLAKIDRGDADCAVVAAAGLIRIGRQSAISGRFPEAAMLPAPAQGALAIEIRSADSAIRETLQELHCRTTAACVTAERAFMSALEGGCHVPVAALATLESDGMLRLRGRILSVNGAECVGGELSASSPLGNDVGEKLAQILLDAGGDQILRSVREELP